MLHCGRLLPSALPVSEYAYDLDLLTLQLEACPWKCLLHNYSNLAED